jgi:hypothetical protein
MGRTTVFVLSAFLLAAGCTTTATRADFEHESNFLEQPLRDVGAVQRQAPGVLIQAMDAPYALPDPPECGAILAEVAALDGVLGADLDQPGEDDDGFEEDAGEMVSAAMRGLVNVPYSGVIRWLSGAERRDRQIREAILAGMVRRAFLKGVAHSLGCGAAPAAPGSGAGPP